MIKSEQVMTDDFVAEIKKKADENVKNITRNCMELHNMHIEIYSNMAEASNIFKQFSENIKKIIDEEK